jgi:ribonuclease HI
MSAEVTLYTDGSSRGNPGPGGFGAILISGQHSKEVSQGFRRTTNNRMELMSVIKGLEMLKKDGCRVTVYSDSKYVVEAVEKGWLASWVKQDFKKKKNRDLWMRYLDVARRHTVSFRWIKGHNDHPFNERCDELAVAAASGRNLPPDEGYESGEFN